ncbi:caspase family protein [Pseudorhodobacter sp. E13]|uniref:caspase family protein n=1 Tax=Pseudorhodobacter sp. E13 TaxID=2487931 RepID=UPI001F203A04|nr:caspase family protein [Pseudorhodobacter sp. E13]
MLVFFGIARFCGLALLCAVLMAPATAVAGQGRVALVIGNQAYQHLPRLTTSRKDAQAVADALRRLGFAVTLLTDASSQAFQHAVTSFAQQARSAETVVFYYAGHGVQIDGRNHLLPVTARLDLVSSGTEESWKLDSVVAQLQASNAQVLLFLDACRAIPMAGNSGAQAGLAQMQTRAGTFISFAARPGAVSFDPVRATGHSLYTAALLRYVEQPGLSVSDVMIKLRNDVEAASDGQQSPWDQSSLRAQVYLHPAAARSTMPSFAVQNSDAATPPQPEATPNCTFVLVALVCR